MTQYEALLARFDRINNALDHQQYMIDELSAGFYSSNTMMNVIHQKITELEKELSSISEKMNLIEGVVLPF